MRRHARWTVLLLMVSAMLAAAAEMPPPLPDLREQDTITIGLNVSHVSAFPDGLSASEREGLEAALGPWRSRIVRAEALPLEYISIRLPEMLPTYQHMMRTAHAIIATAFSTKVITPGNTTTQDVAGECTSRA